MLSLYSIFLFMPQGWEWIILLTLIAIIAGGIVALIVFLTKSSKNNQYVGSGVEVNAVQQGAPPKTWLVESILVTLFCCLPFGIVGIVNASKVESAFYAGNMQEALRLSNEAGKWTKIGFGIGLAGTIIYLIFTIIGVAVSNY
ncbi:MAG: CD225/dispanin family protein [Dysgonamonadaceae bacterium]|jgi:hypothetical protein|nr:CD225/dispanin family protein [Dysgonamonadaceae bacterium]